MTTIAWDGVVLAADRRTVWGNTPTEAEKVFKVTRNGATFLFGCAGLARDAYAYQRWAFGEIDRPEFTEFTVMCIDEQRRIWTATEKMMWVQVRKSMWAVGSGCDYALGAMAARKSAREAIVIASGLDINTGGGVDWVQF